MKITAVTPAELDRLGDEYTARVVRSMRRVLRATVDRANGHLVPSALTVIPTLWAAEVDGDLARWLARGYWTGVNSVYAPIVRALTASAAIDAADPGIPPELATAAERVTLARVSASLAERHLAGATNRLVGIGDHIWQVVQAELIDGMNAGEGVEALAERITGSGGLARPRVEVIARTECHRAVNAGAIAQARSAGVQTKTWVAVGDARTRPEHLDADGQAVPINDTFTVGGEDIDVPGEGSPENSINCFPGDIAVQAPAGLMHSYRRWYDGPLVMFDTASGVHLAATPNHPILTVFGWKAAQEVDRSDQLIKAVAVGRMSGSDPEVHDMPATFAQIHDALMQSGYSERISGSGMDFHGDGRPGEVEVVAVDSDLPVPSEMSEQVFDGLLHASGSLAGPGGSPDCLFPIVVGATVGNPLAQSPHGVGGGRVGGALLERHCLHSQSVGVATAAWLHSSFEQSAPDGWAADAQLIGETLLADAFEVTADQIVNIKIETFHGYVHNLSTPVGWYLANAIVSHNCRCTCSYEIADDQLSAPEEEAMTATITTASNIAAAATTTTAGQVDVTLVDHDHSEHAEDCGCALDDAAEHFGTSKSVSSKPWNGSPGNFTDEQYQNSAAACDPASKGSVKQRCFLPHHDPGGALNRAGLGAAAGRVSALSGRNPQAAARAKSHLRGHYNQIGEDVPDALKAEDEDTAALATPPGLKPCPPGTKPDGKGGCMKSAEADDLAELGGRPNPGTKKDKRLHENNPPKKKGKTSARLTEALADAAAPETAPQWRGPLLVEGRETGDRREFSKGSITWPDPGDVPLILQWQKETGHGSDHDVTVSVGRIDRVWKDGDLVMGEGRYDVHPDAVEYQRRVEAGFAGGISVNADDIADADVEAVYDQPDGEEEEGDLFSMLFARPTKIIYHAGRLRGATGCDIPAFIESKITAVDAEAEPLAAPQRVAATHETDTSPDEWDGDAQLARLRMVNPRAVAADAFAWIGATGEQVPLAECWGLHHEIDRSGDPLAANLTACLQAIMALHDSPVPKEDREAVHRHLASHLYDAGIRPPVYEPEQALLAHAWQDELWHPPRAWFADPKLTVPTPIIVTDAGQIFGLATEWNTCHIGYANKCVPPPRETYHDRFMTGTVTCDDGTEVPVGQITAGIGHASTEYGVSAVQAAEHYDNTSAVVADVAIGNCKLGIWVAGAIRPWAEAQRVQSLKASGQVSPDWRRIGGQMRLVGLLTVNVSGFQVDGAALSKPRLRTVYREGKLEAMIASGFSSVHMGPVPLDAAQQKKAELLRVREVLWAEIHGERVS